MNPYFFKDVEEGVILAVKITPKSSKSEIVGIEGKELKLRIAAVPEKGAANQEIIRFLSKKLNIAKSQITLLSGETSRHKKVLIHGLSSKGNKFIRLFCRNLGFNELL